MRSWQVGVKLLTLVTVVFAATCTFADIYVPPPRALSHAGWLLAMRQHSFLLRLLIPCSMLAVFLVVMVASVRRKRPSYLVWLACCLPVVLLSPQMHKFEFFSVLCVAGTSWFAAG